MTFCVILTKLLLNVFFKSSIVRYTNLLTILLLLLTHLEAFSNVLLGSLESVICENSFFEEKGLIILGQYESHTEEIDWLSSGDYYTRSIVKYNIEEVLFGEVATSIATGSFTPDWAIDLSNTVDEVWLVISVLNDSWTPPAVGQRQFVAAIPGSGYYQTIHRTGSLAPSGTPIDVEDDNTITGWLTSFFQEVTLPISEFMEEINSCFPGISQGISDSLQDLMIFPNPCDEVIQIQSNENLVPRSFRIYNIDGQLVLSEATSSVQIDVSFLNSGLYFIEIEDESHQISKGQFVKL